MIRILHLSDPHFGAADACIAEAFLERAFELRPDVTVLSGDLTMRARRRELEAARKFVEGLPSPRIVIPGNHDIPGVNHLFDRFFRPFRRYRGIFGPELEPEHAQDGLHIVSLNSCRPFGWHRDWSEGRICLERLQRAALRFASNEAGEQGLRILVLHHPLLAPEGLQREVVKPLPDLLSLIGRNRVDLVLCGHFHVSHLASAGGDETWQGIVSQAATVCSTRLQGEPQGFHEICWSGERIDIVRHRFAGEGFVPGLTFSFHRGEAGWRAANAVTGAETEQIRPSDGAAPGPKGHQP